MARLSEKSLLAIAAVVDVALHARGQPVAAKALAERHGLPPRHLEPVLQARCVQCHGAAKTEGELRLDGPDGLRKGGKSGPAFVAGQAAKSEIVRRIWLPAADPDVMPPRGQRSLTPAEASLIRWWIDRGAKFDQKVIDDETKEATVVRE